MNFFLCVIIILCTFLNTNDANTPFIPPVGKVPFAGYFNSRYRGVCVVTMISRSACLTAAVCVCDARRSTRDRRFITVIVGTYYRHPERGIKLQATTLLLPKIPSVGARRGYTMQMSVAVLLLKHAAPDSLTEFPVRGIAVDYLGKAPEPEMQSECATFGWHFFNPGTDKIYPPMKFILKRWLRVQILDVVKMHKWCEVLLARFQASLDAIGYSGLFEQNILYCLRDPTNTAQPCQGMYGAPMICNGKVTGMMMAPDGQWTNCTGCSNIYNKIFTPFLLSFFDCVAGVFQPEFEVDMTALKNSYYEGQGVAFQSNMYDQLVWNSNSSAWSD